MGATVCSSAPSSIPRSIRSAARYGVLLRPGKKKRAELVVRLAPGLKWSRRQAVLADWLLHQATVGIQPGCVGGVVAEDQEQQRLATPLAWCHDGFCLVGCSERELVALLQRPLLGQEPIKLVERIVIQRKHIIDRARPALALRRQIVVKRWSLFRGLRLGGRPLSRRRSFSRRLRSLSTLARSVRSWATRRISASEKVQRPPSFRPIGPAHMTWALPQVDIGGELVVSALLSNRPYSPTWGPYHFAEMGWDDLAYRLRTHATRF